MANRTLFSRYTPALALATGVLWAVGARTAPAPKGEPPEKIPEGGVAAEAAEGDAAKAQAASTENLKRLALAVHSYIDDHKGQLPSDVTDKDGKTLLSWRVLLLPYLDQAELYKQFKLDQPWDGEANKKLLAKMPAVFASPRVRLKAPGHTVYQGFAGPGAIFEPGKQMLFPASIPDGTSNTILAVEASVAFPWTKPADLPFDDKKNLPDFGKAYAARPLAVLCDGSVRVLDLTKVSAQTLKHAITRAGGEILGPDW
jgi:Protein of unknown function (DUF1559)